MRQNVGKENWTEKEYEGPQEDEKKNISAIIQQMNSTEN